MKKINFKKSTISISCAIALGGFVGHSSAATLTNPCAGLPTWSSSGIYVGGQYVQYNNVEYKANWWTQGNDPTTNSGGVGSGKPWTQITNCTTVSPSPSPSPSPAASPSPSPIAYAKPNGKWVGGYFPSWSYWRQPYGQKKLLDSPAANYVDYAFLTLVTSANAGKTETTYGGGTIVEPSDIGHVVDIDYLAEQTVAQSNYKMLSDYKTAHPGTILFASVGGWSYGPRFTQFAADYAKNSAVLTNFVSSTVSWLTANPQFDGINIDWEFPGYGQDETSANHKGEGALYNAMIAQLRTALDKLGNTNKRHYYLTVAGVANSNKAAGDNGAIDWKTLAKNIDWVDFMGFDIHGEFDGPTGTAQSMTDPQEINAVVSWYIKQGVPAAQIVMGLPLYARQMLISNATVPSDANNYGFGASLNYSGIGLYTPDTNYLNPPNIQPYYPSTGMVDNTGVYSYSCFVSILSGGSSKSNCPVNTTADNRGLWGAPLPSNLSYVSNVSNTGNAWIYGTAQNVITAAGGTATYKAYPVYTLETKDSLQYKVTNVINNNKLGGIWWWDLTQDSIDVPSMSLFTASYNSLNGVSPSPSPSPQPSPSSLPTPSGTCANIPVWVAGSVYTGGNIVQENGNQYKANWWTNNEPAANVGVANSGKDWLLIGACSSSSGGGGTTVVAKPDGTWVGGYFANWSYWRKPYGQKSIITATGSKAPKYVDYAFLTMVTSTNASKTETTYGGGTIVEPSDIGHVVDIDYLAEPTIAQGNYTALTSYRSTNPGTLIIASIGGWSYAPRFSQFAADYAKNPAVLTNFVNSAITWISSNNFDGINIDWEFPGFGQDETSTGHTGEGALYNVMITQLRTALDNLGAKNNRHYYLTVASVANSTKAAGDNASINWKTIAANVDWIDLMGFDINGEFNGPSGTSLSMSDPKDLNTVIDWYISQGVPSKQIVLGLPLYARQMLVGSQPTQGNNYGYNSSLNYSGIALYTPDTNYLNPPNVQPYYPSTGMVDNTGVYSYSCFVSLLSDGTAQNNCPVNTTADNRGLWGANLPSNLNYIANVANTGNAWIYGTSQNVITTAGGTSTYKAYPVYTLETKDSLQYKLSNVVTPKQLGGVWFWDLTQDTTVANMSLFNAASNQLNP